MSNELDLLALVRSVDLGSLEWRHHGLGMLQGEIDETMRVHIWHPDLRTLPFEGYRDVHDHRFSLTSTVLIGRIVDIRYDVTPTLSSEGNTDAWEIKHAKIQVAEDMRVVDTGPPDKSPNTRHLFRAHVREVRYRTIHAVDRYSVERRQWHTTRVDGFALTVVQRSDFDDKPARVLGARAHSAIVKYDDEDPARVSHEALVQRVVEMAKGYARS